MADKPRMKEIDGKLVPVVDSEYAGAALIAAAVSKYPRAAWAEILTEGCIQTIAASGSPSRGIGIYLQAMRLLTVIEAQAPTLRVN